VSLLLFAEGGSAGRVRVNGGGGRAADAADGRLKGEGRVSSVFGGGGGCGRIRVLR